MAGIQGKIPEMFTEIFFVDDNIYMFSDYRGNEGEWLKKDDMSDDMVEKMKEKHLNPKEHLNMFKQYIDDFSLKQSNDLYILRLDVNDRIKSFTEFAKQTMKSNIFSDDLVETEKKDSLDSIMFNSMSLTLVINKESFIIKTYDVKMDIVMESGGEKSHLVQTMSSEYSNFNNVDSIEVPETVKTNAIHQ